MTHARNFFSLVILRLLRLGLLILHVASEHAYLLIPMLLKVEPVLFAKPQLQKVVIETLLADTDLLGCIFQTVAY